MKSVRLEQNADGTWTAWIFSTYFTGSRSQCMAWLNAQGEEA